MIDVSQARANLIADATQDYVGLYEIVGDLTAQYPQASETEKIMAARAIVLALLQSGNAAILRSDTWPPRTYEQLNATEALSIIESEASFTVEQTSNTPIYWITINDSPSTAE